MSDAYDLGRAGEEAAARYLTFHDYRLLARNWRFEHAEIDLIAEAFGLFIVVEVKTRATEAYGDGLDSVDAEKQRLLARAAEAYIRQHGLHLPVRFDVITVTGRQAPFRITHYRDAFLPPSAGDGSGRYFRPKDGH